MTPARRARALAGLPGLPRRTHFMKARNRREFLADVGRGMLVASVGAAVAADLGLAPASAGEGSDTLTFGSMEPLVAMMQETPVAKILPRLVEKMREGVGLRTLVAAGA